MSDTTPPLPQRTESGTDILLDLLANPFSSQVNTASFYASLGYSFGISVFLAVLFCILRPRTNAVYAPRAKYADKKHAPPPVGKGLFSWVEPIKTVKEAELVEKIGLDATIFLRFLRMNRNIFLCLTAVGCGILIPINLSGAHPAQYDGLSVYSRLTPQYLAGTRFWAFVVVAYLFNVIICVFLWWNYNRITKLRRAYFLSADYLSSLHARTLFITRVPKANRSDEGLLRIVDQAKRTEDTPTTAISRNTRDLPDLIEEYEETVRRLEKVLAKYLANPQQLPPTRPTMRPNKHDKGYQGQRTVDSIDYLTARIQELGTEIQEVRETVDKRNPLPYGFASYVHIEDAHSVAYAARMKGPEGTLIRLAPKPSDIIWKNLDITPSRRRARYLWSSFWIFVLTILYIAPNALTAIFLSNLYHLGRIWPAFNRTLYAHKNWWGVVQGILAPTLQTLFYFFLPTVFRRLTQRSGDPTKTSRERHVMNRLYAFFVFNNLFVFSLFSAAWSFVTAVIAAQRQGVWEAIKQANLAKTVFSSLCSISPYWITWQVQRLLGASVDLIQAWALIVSSFRRHFLNPTPREMIELTAPPPFLYSSYYNNYLFAATAGLAYATLQPLTLPITAFYFGLEAWLKKYLLQYVFITKTESEGAFWHNVFNRWLFATLLSDFVIALEITAQGSSWNMLYAMAPLPFLLIGFKFFCDNSFETQFIYYSTKSLAETERGVAAAQSGSDLKKAKRSADRVGVRYGNPVLYRKLITPMVPAKSQHWLKQVYKGRLDDDDVNGFGGARTGPQYSDIYMSQMAPAEPGKPAVGFAPTPGDPAAGPGATPIAFEIVADHEMDFENFKRRAEFRAEFGGEGELYGRPEDNSTISRPGTPSSMTTMSTTMAGAIGAPAPFRDSPFDSAPSTRTSSATRFPNEHLYPRGYAGVQLRDNEHDHDSEFSPDGSVIGSVRGRQRMQPLTLTRFTSADITASRPTSVVRGEESDLEDDTGGLLTHAAGMGNLHPPPSRITRKPIGAGVRTSIGIDATPGERAAVVDGDGYYFNLPPTLMSSEPRSEFTSGRATPLPGEGTLLRHEDDEEDTSYDLFRRSGRA